MSSIKSTEKVFLVVRASFITGDLRPNGSCRSKTPLMSFPTAKKAERYLLHQLSSAYLQFNPFREGDWSCWGQWSKLGDFCGLEEELLATLARLNISPPSSKLLANYYQNQVHNAVIDWWDSMLPHLSLEQAQAVWSACENFHLLEIIEMPWEALDHDGT